jgi:hypothetical protein
MGCSGSHTSEEEPKKVKKRTTEEKSKEFIFGSNVLVKEKEGKIRDDYLI